LTDSKNQIEKLPVTLTKDSFLPGCTDPEEVMVAQLEKAVFRGANSETGLITGRFLF
jgi:hypothetical protein